MSSTAASLLKVSDLSVVYQTQERSVRALRNVSLDVPSSGYTVAIVGESGSGKTTLGMSMLNVIEPPGRITGGEIDFMGRNILKMEENELRDYRWAEVAMVYQSAMNCLNPVHPVVHPIIEVIREHKKAGKQEAKDMAMRLLTELGIPPNRAHDYPHEFSGGMRQRVVIALALALSPKLLVIDEPTSALDVVVQRQILTLLRQEVVQRNLSLVFITHEISLLPGIVDNVIVMYKGDIVEQGPLERVLFDPKHPYTEMLVSTLLTLDSTPDALADLERRTTDVAPEDACPYVNRCKYAFDRCKVERPLLREIENGRTAACHKYT